MNKTNIFGQLLDIAISLNSLDSFLHDNMQSLHEFYNLQHNDILQYKDSIYEFIMYKHNIVDKLDYSKSYTRAFAIMLLDFCERFNFISATPIILRILSNNEIAVNSRMQAAMLFLYPKPNTNSELIDKFEQICDKLQFAIDNEEDDRKKANITFLNYFSIIIQDTNDLYAKQGYDKIVKSIQNERYEFLREIPTLLDIQIDNLDLAFEKVQELIDLNRNESPFDELEVVCRGYLIEENTDYEEQLKSVSCNFDSIRGISIRNSTGTSATNRGVKILESEEELYEYIKRFGNMHKAKLMSALSSPFPQEFSEKINLIDWGCGQAIASMLFYETFENAMIEQITLIEPSEVALKRAALHCRKYAPQVPINTICKKLDDVLTDDINALSAGVTVNLFSNILDLDDYSLPYLIETIEKGQSELIYFVCVSPYIDDVKTDKINSFMRHFKAKYETFKSYHYVMDTKISDYWYCNNTFKSGQVKHGEYGNCHDNYTNYCSNKWTRVLSVFSVSK